MVKILVRAVRKNAGFPFLYLTAFHMVGAPKALKRKIHKNSEI